MFTLTDWSKLLSSRDPNPFKEFFEEVPVGLALGGVLQGVSALEATMTSLSLIFEPFLTSNHLLFRCTDLITNRSEEACGCLKRVIVTPAKNSAFGPRQVSIEYLAAILV